MFISRRFSLECLAVFGVVLVTFALLATSTHGRTWGDDLPDSPVGRAAAAFFEAINSGDPEQYRQFTLTYRTRAVIEQTPMDERLDQFSRFIEDWGQLDIHGYEERDEYTLGVTAQSRFGDWYQFNFQLQSEPPHKLVGIRIGQADPPEPENAAPEDMSNPAITRRVTEYLDRLRRLGFSGAAIVARDGDILLEQGYGLADRENNIPVSPETIFTTGSVTKQFTGAAIMKLVMQGKLDVKDSITKYFDNVPPDMRQITLHQLLTHSAGFPGALGDDFDATATRDRLEDLALNAELLFIPGEGYSYSNVGYTLLAIIIEKVSGIGYEAFLRTHLFKPAGMMDTGYPSSGMSSERIAVGYRDGRRWGTFLDRPHLSDGPGWHLRGNGGIHSTVGDMYKWHLALNGSDILSEEAKEQYFAPHVDEGGGESFYGYGWSNWTTRRGTRVLQHNGGNMVYEADCYRFVDEGVFLYVVSNSPLGAIRVAETLKNVIFGHDYRMPPDVRELSDVDLARYSGRYSLDDGGIIEVQPQGNHLRLSGGGLSARNVLAGRAAGSELGGGTGRLSDRALKLAESWGQGDLQSIYKAFGERIPMTELEDDLGRMHDMRDNAYGAYKSCEIATVLSGGPRTQVYIRMHHARGSGFVQLDFMQGRLARFEPVREVPKTDLVLFALSDETFVTFDIRTRRHREVTFVPSPDGTVKTILFSTPQGPIKAMRQ